MLLILGLDALAGDTNRIMRKYKNPGRSLSGTEPDIFTGLVLDGARPAIGSVISRSVGSKEQVVDAADYHGNDGDCEDNYHCVKKEDCSEHFSLS